MFLKNNNYAYIPLYIHKALSTLGNKKEQQQVKFYEKLLGEMIFLQVTENLNMICFTRLAGRVFKK